MEEKTIKEAKEILTKMYLEEYYKERTNEAEYANITKVDLIKFSLKLLEIIEEV